LKLKAPPSLKLKISLNVQFFTFKFEEIAITPTLDYYQNDIIM